MEKWVAVTTLYAAPALITALCYWLLQRRKAKHAQRLYQTSVEDGLLEPASLHPVVDNSRCLGCATCVSACPEQKQVLGIIENRARLVTPASCIGHGACKTACPTGAISLVFGTETRGVDIPNVGPDFQTNVPGIYIAGELGGMGLIRNAIEQGRQAIDSIAANGRTGKPGQVDVVVVGAGPAGISAAMAAVERGLSYRLLEQDTVGGTISHYPRGKVVMTAPAKLPLVGEFHFGETSKENLMDFWTGAIDKAGLVVDTGTRVEAIERNDAGFVVQAGEDIPCGNVLLTIGRRGTPRKLGVPGEEHSKVVYRLVDPAQYQGMRVLVVGGGDSALEAALSLSAESGTDVVLSYRGEAFNRVKAKNRELIGAASEDGRLALEMSSQVVDISASTVRLNTTHGEVVMDNDAIIVCAGGILPNAFLKTVGIEVETHFGTVR